MNVTLSALTVAGIYTSPFIHKQTVQLLKSRFNNFFYPALFNVKNLFVKASSFSKFSQSAIVFDKTYSDTFYSQLSLVNQSNIKILIHSSDFDSIQKTAIYADNSQGDTLLIVRSTSFMSCKSHTKSGCIYSTFKTIETSRVCVECCSSEESGHFINIIDAERVFMNITNIHKSPTNSTAPSVINLSIHNDITDCKIDTINFTHNRIVNNHALITSNTPYIQPQFLLSLENSGSSIVWIVSTDRSTFAFADFVNNTGNTESIIYVRGTMVFMNIKMVGNLHPLFDVSFESTLSMFGCKIDQPADTWFELSYNDQFNITENITTQTFDSPLNIQCLIQDDLERPKEIIISFFVIITLVVISMSLSVSCIIYRETRKTRPNEISTSDIHSNLL